jgi:hypothetical protein
MLPSLELEGIGKTPLRRLEQERNLRDREGIALIPGKKATPLKEKQTLQPGTG